jgi:cyclic pyranopterin phosphate synthase
VSGPRQKSKKAKALSHFDDSGQAHMVWVGQKPETERIAVASGSIVMQAATLEQIRQGSVGKGDVLGIARTAGLMAVKRTADLIPLCHPLRITSAEIELETLDAPEPAISIRATVKAIDRTGVEMEALTAVAVTALTVYDMCKSVDRAMEIREIRLDEKSGGASGRFRR